jgi:hypothetical protein
MPQRAQVKITSAKTLLEEMSRPSSVGLEFRSKPPALSDKFYVSGFIRRGKLLASIIPAMGRNV